MYLETETFKTVIKSTPLVSIDLIVQRNDGKVLLGYRTNRPAQGFLFVPGGRIQKDEPMSVAFKRLTRDELGVEFPLSQAECLGPFEHFYPDNVTGSDFSTHYIALGYRLHVDDTKLTFPKDQHSQYIWLSPDELRAHPSVHPHTCWYFEPL